MSHDAIMEHMAQMGGDDARRRHMMGAMDLNDIDYDAYLANDRTLDDPEVVRVEAGGRVRLRIINGASATAFTIDTGPPARRADRRRRSGHRARRGLDLPDSDGPAARHPPVAAQGGRRFPGPGAARRRARTGRNHSRLGRRAGREAAVLGAAKGRSLRLDLETRLNAARPLAAQRAPIAARTLC